MDRRKRSRSQPKPPDATAVLDAFHEPLFDTSFLPEPLLVFGDGRREPDPKTGLALHKPYDLATPGRRLTIRLGIIGTGPMIDAAHGWIDRCTREVLPMIYRKRDGVLGTEPVDSLASPQFPGLAQAFSAEFVVGENMTAELTSVEVADVLRHSYFEQRVTRLVQIITAKTRVLAEGMHQPDVIIIALPTEIRKKCTIPSHNRTRGKPRWTLAHALRETLTEEKASGQSTLFELSESEATKLEELEETENEIDQEHGVFHHALKAAAMQFGVPVQLAWQTTLEGSPSIEDNATRAWNFWTGVYYKAGGIPWRVQGLSNGTCYVGVAFYRDRREDTLRTSVAQAFSDRGEGIVLRSEPFEWSDSEQGRTPHLPRDVAYSLTKAVVEAYRDVHGALPARVVVHKWQRYYADERAGFEDALSESKVSSSDLVAFGDRGIRFFRLGAEPVLRGTLVQLSAGNALLYTRGYVPFLSTYPGMRVPRPLEVVEHFGSSSLRKICEEILALTKMDWNSAAFAQKEPITTAFSEDVGHILAELPPGAKPRTLYRFYM
jgi:hypothetical protein